MVAGYLQQWETNKTKSVFSTDLIMESSIEFFSFIKRVIKGKRRNCARLRESTDKGEGYCKTESFMASDVCEWVWSTAQRKWMTWGRESVTWFFKVVEGCACCWKYFCMRDCLRGYTGLKWRCKRVSAMKSDVQSKSRIEPLWRGKLVCFTCWMLR